jgi:catechol 2,3-dioxygenase
MRIGHVHLKVAKLEEAISFYSELLNFKVTERIDNDFAFMSGGEAHHELALQQATDMRRPTPGAIGLYHTAFEARDLPEFKAKILKMQQLGLRFSVVDHGISWAAYTEDPSLNGIEIYLDRRSHPDGFAEWKGRSKILRPNEVLEAE